MARAREGSSAAASCRSLVVSTGTPMSSRRESAVLSVSPWLDSRKTVSDDTVWNLVNCSGSVALAPLSSSVCVGGKSSAS